MRLPKQSVAAVRSPSVDEVVGFNEGVAAQLRICTPCLGLPSGRVCFNLGPFGRRCVTIPNLGRWQFCCRTRFGWPPVSCGLSRCG
jgi:hypothetical protein